LNASDNLRVSWKGKIATETRSGDRQSFCLSVLGVLCGLRNGDLAGEESLLQPSAAPIPESSLNSPS
jgi:hypothetical protein